MILSLNFENTIVTATSSRKSWMAKVVREKFCGSLNFIQMYIHICIVKTYAVFASFIWRVLKKAIAGLNNLSRKLSQFIENLQKLWNFSFA